MHAEIKCRPANHMKEYNVLPYWRRFSHHTLPNFVILCQIENSKHLLHLRKHHDASCNAKN